MKLFVQTQRESVQIYREVDTFRTRLELWPMLELFPIKAGPRRNYTPCFPTQAKTSLHGLRINIKPDGMGVFWRIYWQHRSSSKSENSTDQQTRSSPTWKLEILSVFTQRQIQADRVLRLQTPALHITWDFVNTNEKSKWKNAKYYW